MWCNEPTFAGSMPQTGQHRIRSLISLGIPVVAGQVGLVLMGNIDNLMVGKIGYESLAAATIANQVFFLVSVFGMGVIMAVTALASILIGDGKTGQIRFLTIDSTIISTILGIVSFAVIWWCIDNFHFLRQPEAIIPEAQSYLFIVGLSVLPLYWYFNFKAVADAHSLTIATMIVTLGSLVINVFFNWLLIYGNWGFPAMGLDGAGYATLISRILMAIAMLGYVHNSSRIRFAMRHFFIRRKHMQPGFTGQILKVGLPSGLQFFYEVSAFAFSGIMAGWIGVREMAGHTIALSLAAFTYMFASGLATASTIKVGDAYGRKNHKEVDAYGNLSIKMIAVCMIFFAAVFLVLREPLVRIFVKDPGVIHIASGLLIVAAAFQLFDGIQAVSLGNLRGIKDTKVPSYVALVAYWVVGVPLSYFLGIKGGYGMYGIWAGLTAGLAITAILLSLRFRKLSKSLFQ